MKRDAFDSARVFDIAIAVAAIVVTAPVLLVAAIAVMVTSRGSVLFQQARVGQFGRLFDVYKFRTMYVNDIDPITVGTVSSEHRLVTPVGGVLRRLKIDELPQLWNVLAGDMSLFGPRPTLLEQAADYDDVQRRRLQVRPGLTGWAQVNGNIRLSWDDRILLDLWYVDHRSLSLNLRILWKTVWVVIFGERPSVEAIDAARIHRSG